MRRERLSIRDVATRIAYSYEHVRKVFKGQTGPSRELNLKLAEVFGWNVAATWRVAAHEHLKRRARAVDPGVAPPRGGDMQELWNQLTQEQQSVVAGVARAFATVNEFRESEPPPPDAPKPQLTLLK